MLFKITNPIKVTSDPLLHKIKLKAKFVGNFSFIEILFTHLQSESWYISNLHFNQKSQNILLPPTFIQHLLMQAYCTLQAIGNESL